MVKTNVFCIRMGWIPTHGMANSHALIGGPDRHSTRSRSESGGRRASAASDIALVELGAEPLGDDAREVDPTPARDVIARILSANLNQPWSLAVSHLAYVRRVVSELR